MCDPVTIGTALVGALASGAVSSAMAPKSAPKAEAQPSQAASTQTASAPVAPKAADSSKTGGMPPPGANDTLLTGPGGATAGADQIGRNTILGG